MRLLLHALMLQSTAVTGRARAQAAADSSAIRATALDYAEGWYEGNADRMARALHPELVKRIVVRDTTTGKTMVQGMGASVLVNSTRHGYGKETPKGNGNLNRLGDEIPPGDLQRVSAAVSRCRSVYHSDGPAVRFASPLRCEHHPRTDNPDP